MPSKEKKLARVVTYLSPLVKPLNIANITHALFDCLVVLGKAT